MFKGYYPIAHPKESTGEQASHTQLTQETLIQRLMGRHKHAVIHRTKTNDGKGGSMVGDGYTI